MTPVYQRTGAKPGETGDCFAACIASVFDLRLDDVPNFNASGENGKPLPHASIEMLTTWMKGRGHAYAELGFVLPLDDMLVRMAELLPYTTYLLTGRTNSYRLHTVVARAGQIIHDPGMPSGQHSLRGPCHDDYWRVGLFLWDR